MIFMKQKYISYQKRRDNKMTIFIDREKDLKQLQKQIDFYRKEKPSISILDQEGLELEKYFIKKLATNELVDNLLHYYKNSFDVFQDADFNSYEDSKKAVKEAIEDKKNIISFLEKATKELF